MMTGWCRRSSKRCLSSLDRVKLIYVVPDFQNPTGRRWSLERRRALAELAGRFGVPVIEDAPYAELCFEGEPLPPSPPSARRARWCTSGPSPRSCRRACASVGWLPTATLFGATCSSSRASTSTPPVSSSFWWRVSCSITTSKPISHGCATSTVGVAMRCCVRWRSSFPPEVSFTRPAGGLFLWVVLPDGIDARRLLERAIEEDVAFVPGESFFPGGGHENTLRLNFSAMPEERIAEGIRRLGRVLSTVPADVSAAV